MARLCDQPIPTALPTRLIVAVDAFALATPETAAALASMIARLSRLIGETCEETMAPPGLTAWGRAQRTLQPYEAWLTFKDWIERDNPRMAFMVARGLILGSMIPASERIWAALMRDEVRARHRPREPCRSCYCCCGDSSQSKVR